MKYERLEVCDPEVYALLKKEEQRQKEGLEMVPSENYTSSASLEAVGSIMNDKYAEGYPKKRYYGGNEYIDEMELLCKRRALALFGLSSGEWAVNVQPYSGSPANLAVYFGLLEFGDTIMSLSLSQGGHLTHGAEANFSGKAYKVVNYPLDSKTERIDYAAVRRLAREHKPKLILCGYTAYPRIIDFEAFGEISREVGAFAMADIAHIAGLIAGGAHPSPFPHMDVVTTTTHKTLRGPRAAIIFSRRKAERNGVSISELIDKAVFPGMQGGPHENTIAGVAVALREDAEPSFKEYAEQIVKNSQALAEALAAEGLRLVSGGTDNHLLLVDFTPFGPGKGVFIQKALEAVGVTVNKNAVPGEQSSPFYPSGIRLGTPALTSRGMKEDDMRRIGTWITKVVKAFAATELPHEKEARTAAVKAFTASLASHELVRTIREEIKAFANTFPVPGIDD